MKLYIQTTVQSNQSKLGRTGASRAGFFGMEMNDCILKTIGTNACGQGAIHDQ